MRTVYIAHACSDENGWDGYEGSKPGDQTGTEVRTNKYLDTQKSIQFNVVLRWKNPLLANAHAIRSAQAAQNDNFGYSQMNRESGGQALEEQHDPSKVTKKVELDCSRLQMGLVKTLLEEVGLPTNGIKGTEVTAQMRNALLDSGYFDDATATVNLSTGDGLILGDILLKAGKHTASVCEVKEDAPLNQTMKFIGQIAESITSVYADPNRQTFLHFDLGAGLQSVLGYENLTEVCDEVGDMFYCHIAQKYFGFVRKDAIRKVEPEKEITVGSQAVFDSDRLFYSSYPSSGHISADKYRGRSCKAVQIVDNAHPYLIEGNGFSGWCDVVK